MCMENVENWNALVTMRQGVTRIWNRITNSTSPLRTLYVMITSLKSSSTFSTTTSSPSRTPGQTSLLSPRPNHTSTLWTLPLYQSCQNTFLMWRLMMSFTLHISGGRSFMRWGQVVMTCPSHFVIFANPCTTIKQRRFTQTWQSGGSHSLDAKNWGLVKMTNPKAVIKVPILLIQQRHLR